MRSRLVSCRPCPPCPAVALIHIVLCVSWPLLLPTPRPLLPPAADWYVARFGFRRVAYRGLETGSRNVASHVVLQGTVWFPLPPPSSPPAAPLGVIPVSDPIPQSYFVFSSPLNPDSATELGDDMNAHIALHGDGVKDVAFAVDDARGMFTEAVARGAEPIREPTELTDECGTVIIATVKTYGNTLHSFVQRGAYRVRACRAPFPLQLV